MTGLGSGVYLDEDFDFSVDSSGDLRSTSGLDELEKDLAFRMAIGLNQYLGMRPIDSNRAKVLSHSMAIARADERITFVDREASNVTWDDPNDTLDVELFVRTDTNESYTLVFEV